MEVAIPSSSDDNILCGDVPLNLLLFTIKPQNDVRIFGLNIRSRMAIVAIAVDPVTDEGRLCRPFLTLSF